MSGRILVVDDLKPNATLLEVRLTAEYFDVTIAHNGPDALALCAREPFDVILLDVMMPHMDGFEVCRRLKDDVLTAHIPVVMVTSLDQPRDRVRGLEAGADDFLTKPIDDVALLARVRSLVRYKISQDEVRARAFTALALGQKIELVPETKGGALLLVEDREGASTRLCRILEAQHQVTHVRDARSALEACQHQSFDVALVSLGLQGSDSLRLLSQWRSHQATRSMALIMIAEQEDRDRIVRGLDFGVHDYITRPFDQGEVLARVRTQLHHKRNEDLLRKTIDDSIEAGLVDMLTGLNNRRFFEQHLARLMRHAPPLSLMILDIDFFKRVNDTYGHDVGDAVLKACAARMKAVTRDMDLICRLGGEEFVIIMPHTTLAEAYIIAERVRLSVQQEAFAVAHVAQGLAVTVSIGLAQTQEGLSPDLLFKQADQALYHAKNNGRNQTAQAA